MAQFYFVQNADENEWAYQGIRLVNISDEMQIQPQSRLILTEPTVIADNQMQYVYQRSNAQPVAQQQQTQYVLQEDDIVTDSFTSHQIYVSADGTGEIQRQLQHTGMVQQSPEQQQQQQQQQVIIQQQPQQNRVILQQSPGQPVIVHQPTVQAQNPVVLNNRPQTPMQQQRIIYDTTRQTPVYTITTPQQTQQPQMASQPRAMQQNIIVRQQVPQMRQQTQIRMQQPTLTYQRTPGTVIRSTVAQTRVTVPQPRLSTTSPARTARYRAPSVVATPRSQIAAQRVTRPVRYAPVTAPQQPRPPRVLNASLMRMSQPQEQRQVSFSGSATTTTRMLTPLAKMNRTYPSCVQKAQAQVVAAAPQPSTTSKLEVRNIVPTVQSSNDPNGDLEESITASILEKSQITVNHTADESTASDETFSSQESTYSNVSNGSAVDIKRKVTKAGEVARGRGRGQVAARPAVAKRPVNQSVQDLFNSMTTDVEQTNQQMLLTQSSPECETRESAKMLVILQCGEQRLITFTLPKESCTVQELLEQVGVPFTPDTNIQCVSNPGANIDYVVTVGDPVQDSVSNELLLRTENSMEAPPPPPSQQFQQPQMQPPQPQLQQRTPIRQQQNQFATSTPIPQRQATFAATPQPQLTPIKPPPPVTPEPPEPPKPPAVERKIIQGWLALCNNCGFCGIDHAKCERCHHILGDTYKRIPCSQPKPTIPPPTNPIRTQIPALALPSQSKISKQFVRLTKEPPAALKKLEVVTQKRPIPELTTRTITTTATLSNSLTSSVASTSSTTKMTALPALKVTDGGATAKPRAPAARSRTRAAKAEEPIILTLSSDDEEEDKTPKPKPKSKKSVSTKTEEIKALACEPLIEEKESPIQGNERLCITDLTNAQDKLLTSIQCRTIRIGTLHYEPKEQVIFSSRGVRIIAPSVKNAKENIILDVQIKEVIKIIAHFGKMLPIIFIYVTPNCAQYVRNSLDMVSNTTKGPYFDPCGQKNEGVRRITIVAEVITDETKSVIKSLYSMSELEEIPYKDANELYKRATVKIDQMANTSSASADDEGGSADDVQQILIYPQGKGGISINTEDYKCLAIDQYLNDVIIDFYLNYLRLSIFSEEQREKTHIFSSFFYKRLTAMSTRQRQMEKDLKMTASQKRHHRVKGWTKSVNLFDKEFIIIPINEQSHWFLAIICFPALKGPQTYDSGVPVKVAPLPKKRATKDGEKKVSVTIGNTTITPLTKKEEAIFLNDDSASERDEAEADESDMESEESEPEVEPGHQAIKQPCILIFDSLAGGYRSRVVATLRDYLTCEYKAKVCPTSVHTFNKTNMPGHTVKVPQQNNFTDCGLYLLQYVEEFFGNPIRDYRLPVKQLQNWFTTLAVTKKREDISNLLIELVKEMHPERLDLLPDITFPTQDGKLIETEENFEDAAEFEEEELDDPNFEVDDEDMTEEESPEKKKGKKLLKRSFDKSDKNSPDKKVARTN